MLPAMELDTGRVAGFYSEISRDQRLLASVNPISVGAPPAVSPAEVSPISLGV
jgi:hypothetical protein